MVVLLKLFTPFTLKAMLLIEQIRLAVTTVMVNITITTITTTILIATIMLVHLIFKVLSVLFDAVFTSKVTVGQLWFYENCNRKHYNHRHCNHRHCNHEHDLGEILTILS
jgi:hypothetical protein